MIVLDTLKIGTRDYTLEPHPNLDINSTSSAQTGEIKNEGFIGMKTDGSELFGKSAKIRGQIEEFAWSDIRNGYLWITFSPSSIKSKKVHNMETVDVNDFKNICERLESLLKESGVNVSVNDCSLLRIDVARDRKTCFPFQKYFPAFHSMGFMRGNNRDYPTSYYNGNKQWTTCFYDKLEACKVKGMPIPPIYQGASNVMRCEYRMSNRKKIEKVTSVANISDLINKFDVLENVFNRHVQRVLNFNERATIKSPIETGLGVELEKLRALKKQGCRNIVSDYLYMSGFENTQKIFGGLDSFLKTMVEESLLSRQNAYQWKKKVLDLSQIIGRLEPDSLPGLICELLDQFLKEA